MFNVGFVSITWLQALVLPQSGTIATAVADHDRAAVGAVPGGVGLGLERSPARG